MAKIIKMNDEMLMIGDGEDVLEVKRELIDFYPRVGDEVDIFKKEDEIFVYPKDITKPNDNNNYEPVNIHIQNSNNNVNNGTGYMGRPVNKVTYVLLAFLLGGFGAQKFYSGFVGKGILNLLLCWTGISAIIALIDGTKGILAPADQYGQIYVTR